MARKRKTKELPPFSRITPAWAWGGSDGAGVKVAVLDTGIDAAHPELRGAVAGGIELEMDANGEVTGAEGGTEDLAGHGTACAGIIHRIAPGATLYSIRVLGRGMSGFAPVVLAGIHWAVEEGMDVINLSLGTTNRDYAEIFHELADAAFFRPSILVAAASNDARPSYPAIFSNLLGVRSKCMASRKAGYPFPFTFTHGEPIEMGAPGESIRVPWPGGGGKQVTGNSFACPHVTGLVALILSKHPDLKPFEIQTVLHALSVERR
ncbi:MAG: S8 family serine peptidase [Planctomycetes bacterium]|nr:S8 family serine peptidase [Planctomycetota bacterium]